ncbi:MAG: NAD(P)-dependent glycerol-3-phosphate dehydrogenase [Oscillospiraceae bacterium]|nr:NAD(P)-dependent glycerol-3-phosphate dehydrogenase [Oscillospiraceae bacterium]
MAKITVLGTGGWGIALAVMANRCGHTVSAWSPFKEEINAIRRFDENKTLLPGIAVPPAIDLTADPGCAAEADLTIVAVPSFAIEETAELFAARLPARPLIACAAKGISGKRRLTELIAEKLSDTRPGARMVALSGPSHAEEVGRGLPTTVVSASVDKEAAAAVQELLMNPRFRIYISDDMVGVELGGALKNVIALAAGICDGLGLGDNARAALMTRGLAEMTRLGMAMGARAETFAGLSGMGDLIVTCSSMHSRNRRAGILIGQGLPPDEAVRAVGTVEGYHAAKTAYELAAASGADMPIARQCYRICYEGHAPAEALTALMERPGRHETEGQWLKQNKIFKKGRV